ncbi:MAG: c-type cytochrome [Magnetococcales bacterium]|nr:c-type cytochrome [Magnetococcales bacterium]
MQHTRWRAALINNALAATLAGRIRLLALLLLGAMPAWGADADQMTLEAGRAIYNFRCYFCHGYSGDARTLAASYMAVPPRNFLASDPQEFPPERLENAIAHGRPGTAMPGFASLLSSEEIRQVALFVRETFMTRRLPNTRYHTVENGWPDHDRYRDAFPFVTGQTALDTPEAELTPDLKNGKRLFMGACVTCHDRARVVNDGPVWETRALSWPRNRYSHRDDPTSPPATDAMASATPYARHDRPPALPDPDPVERLGEQLYQKNCAFCHAADGTGRNYIGTFLDPHPRDLTQPGLLANLDLEAVIRDGLPGASMPAWAGVLSGDEITAIARYVRRVFAAPAATP